ncbi:MAG: hypothetical protein ACF8QF_13525 [Phycisphaerales bacterium]
MRTRTIAVALLAAQSAAAHPGSGVDVGPDGAVYFADVFRETIWRVTPGHDPEALIRNTWTHELTLPPDGDLLFFEFEGDGVGGPAPTGLRRWSEDAGVETVFPANHDRSHFGGEAFALLEGVGVLFAAQARGPDGWRQTLRARPIGGDARDFSGALDGPLYRNGNADEATYRLITDMVLAPESAEGGGVYALDRDRVRHVRPDGSATTIVTGLLMDRPPNPPHPGGPSTTNNRLYSLDVDDAGAIYVAYHAGRLVWRAQPGEAPEVRFRSERGWAPIGVATDAGALYILEHADDSQRLRLSRITGDERETIADIRR